MVQKIGYKFPFPVFEGLMYSPIKWITGYSNVVLKMLGKTQEFSFVCDLQLVCDLIVNILEEFKKYVDFIFLHLTEQLNSSSPNAYQCMHMNLSLTSNLLVEPQPTVCEILAGNYSKNMNTYIFAN